MKIGGNLTKSPIWTPKSILGSNTTVYNLLIFSCALCYKLPGEVQATSSMGDWTWSGRPKCKYGQVKLEKPETNPGDLEAQMVGGSRRSDKSRRSGLKNTWKTSKWIRLSWRHPEQVQMPKRAELLSDSPRWRRPKTNTSTRKGLIKVGFEGAQKKLNLIISFSAMPYFSPSKARSVAFLTTDTIRASLTTLLGVGIFVA